MNFLYAAYGATWLIHGVYFGVLIRKYLRLRKEAEELKKN